MTEVLIQRPRKEAERTRFAQDEQMLARLDGCARGDKYYLTCNEKDAA